MVDPKNEKAKAERGRGGRPRRGEAEERHEHLLETAKRLFLADGYSATSIDAIAVAAGMSKRTIYSRYPDKAALFAAILRGLAQRWVDTALTDKDDAAPIETSLRRHARDLVHRATQPEAVAMRALIIGEARRFPELAEAAEQNGWCIFVDTLARYFSRQVARGTLTLRNPKIHAEIFAQLVLGDIQRRTVLGKPPPTARESDAHIRRVVTLFLHGVAAPSQAPKARR